MTSLRHDARRLIACGLVAGGTALSCATLFEDPIQCSSDDDCARFGAACDVTSGVCVPRGEEEAGVETEPPTPERDAAVDRGPTDRCGADPKPTSSIGKKIDGGARAEIAESTTLGCDKDWSLDALVFVREGATLTIEPGTTIRAKPGVGAGLVVSRGARLVARGERDAPIVITSDAATPAPGDFRGVYLLGRAPPLGAPPYEDDPELPWGGAAPDDDSGELAFVRVEYARSGLSVVGAGTKTKIDSVQVRKTAANCFTFQGGTVDAKHLVCQWAGGNQFEFYTKHSGRVQFLFGQKAAPPPVFNSTGILVDDATTAIYNATICGDKPTALNGYGLVFRDNATLDLNDAILSGWFAGMDATGNLPVPGGVRASIYFGNGTDPAHVEGTDIDPDSPTFDDDNGFDERAAFAAGDPPNATTDPGLADCFDPKAPKPWPPAPLATNAKSPPNDGFFDATAKYIGAFKDPNDTWMTGAWVRFDEK